MPEVPVAVIHGRFQVPHNDHLKYLLEGKALCDRLVIGITNPDPGHTRLDPADPSRSDALANPLTYFQRMLLIEAAMMGAGVGREEFVLVPFPINFPELYRYYVPMDALFLLTIYDGWGRRKLELFQSQGLATRVLREVPSQEKGLSSTKVRDVMASGGDWEGMVPPAVAGLLRQWEVPEELARARQAVMGM